MTAIIVNLNIQFLNILLYLANNTYYFFLICLYNFKYDMEIFLNKLEILIKQNMKYPILPKYCNITEKV